MHVIPLTYSITSFIVDFNHSSTIGPGILISYVIGAVSCVFTALAYSEFASRVPVAGSAYTYAYASFGELLAWM